MLSLCKQSLVVHIKRVGIRCLGSVVPNVSISGNAVKNEPILCYMSGSDERVALEKELQRISCETEDIPIIINGEEFRTDEKCYQVMPHNHCKKIAKFYWATPDLIEKAIDASVCAQKQWDSVPIEKRFEIWEKAADLMAGTYRQTLNAATMLGQSKTVIQAEIDSAAELIDFFRFNVHFVKEACKYQPISENPSESKNSMRFRGLDGFIAAISPFNFTAIGGNLAYTPALMGNGVVWKPSDTAMLSNYWIYKICIQAGVPPGVVNFVPADGPTFGKVITQSPHLSGINFTGSVPTFNWLWTHVGKNINCYTNYPRLIGECGGKNYHFIHPSADVGSVVNATIRAAFEYCGQKCSACSRMYVPESLWPKIKEGLRCAQKDLKVGDVSDFSTFMGAVIDKTAYKRITKHIDRACKSSDLEVIAGGKYDDEYGYYVQPTIIQTCDPKDKIMTEEIFGPVLAIYVYPDAKIMETMNLVHTSTPYALTGAVFAQDEEFLKVALEELKMSAGNFYINDKSTGSVVGQQPFGGSRMSGTNDKAGGPFYALRWTTPQCIKETFVPLTEIGYPYMKC